MSVYGKHFSTRSTPQSEPIPGKPMVANSAGGFTFQVDKWVSLHRFLILGSEGGSYYSSEKKLTVENALSVQECIKEDVARVVRTIVEISDGGRAPKNSPAIFVLALVAGQGHTRLAMDVLQQICRIPTHLFEFCEVVQGFRGWGPGLRKGISRWYTERPISQLAYQMVKYQQRNGWSHKNVLQLAHPNPPGDDYRALFRWAVGGVEAVSQYQRKLSKGGEPVAQEDLSQFLPVIVSAFEEAKTADESRIIQLIHEVNLPRECIPTERLNSPGIWEALLQKMPLTALIRNLAKMTAVGLLKPLSQATSLVVDKLSDQEYIQESRIHPLGVLLAAKTYASGRGLKGSLSWTPVSQVNDVLDAAFYKCFENVQPAGRRTIMGLDVSGSMSCTMGGSSISCAEGAAVMAMVTAKTEPFYQLMAFATTFRELDISKCSRLSDVISKTHTMTFGGTDCALPMTWALQNKIEADTFITYSDSESWAGPIHASQALVQYREKTGIPARAICVGMVANQYTVLDPDDAGSMNVVGFDTATPAVIADFSAGSI